MLKKYFSGQKWNFFKYSGGFLHLPISVKTPQQLIASFSKFPFVKHNKTKQSIFANTPFSSGGFHYQNLEDGCWIVYSKIRYKMNVAFDLMNEAASKKEFNAEDGYYMLSLNSIITESNVYKSWCESKISLPQSSWTLFKPFEMNCEMNFKNTNCKYITLFFNQEWLDKYLMNNQLFTESKLSEFIHSDAKNIIWPILEEDKTLNHFKVFDRAMGIDEDLVQTDLLNLRFCVMNLMFDFFKLCAEQEIVDKHVEIHYENRFDVHKVEHYLVENLKGKFPGITFLANRFDISESKLKTDFKHLSGMPVFQYFQQKQMKLAKILLSEGRLSVKEISYKFGYENTSKFSAAFKKTNGLLPTEFIESLASFEK